MTAYRRIGPVALVFVILTGIASAALGVGLVGRADTPFGKAWAAVFIVCGLVVLLGGAVGSRRIADGERAAVVPGVVALVLLAGWAAVVGVLGGVHEHWAWAVLMALPVGYLLWAAFRVVRGS